MPRAAVSKSVQDPKALACQARDALTDKLGKDIVVLDVREVTPVTDYVVIATGSSPPHLKALFAEVQQALKHDGSAVYRRAGSPESGWMVLDYIDCVIHIFSQEARSYYAVEALWEKAPRLP